MKNNKSGFAFIPILIALGLLITGVGAGVVITKKSYSVQPEANVVNAVIQDAPEIEWNDESEETETVTVNEHKESIAPEIVLNPDIKNTNMPEVPINNQLEAIADNIPKIESFLQKEKEIVVTQGDIKQQSDSLTIIVNDAKRIADNKKATMKKEIESCKKYYDYQVESAESIWESDFNSYEQQKSWYSSNSGFYQLTETSNRNEQYLEEDLARSKDRRDDAIESAKTSYESCKDNYEWDTSIDKDISKIIAEQKNIISNVTNDNAGDSLIKINNLIGEAEKLKYSLMLIF